MSLLKAYRKDTVDCERLERGFLDIVSTIYDKPTQDDLLYLLQIYAEYSVGYIIEAAKTLKPNQSFKDTMNIMNSYIVEVNNTLGNKYYHKEEGYSIIDKCVQEYLTFETLSKEKITEFIDEIQESYVEPEDEIQE